MNMLIFLLISETNLKIVQLYLRGFQTIEMQSSRSLVRQPVLLRGSLHGAHRVLRMVGSGSPGADLELMRTAHSSFGSCLLFEGHYDNRLPDHLYDSGWWHNEGWDSLLK